MKNRTRFLTFIITLFPLTVYGQSSDEKSISFSYEQLQPIFKILRTQSTTISPSCIETLKDIHELKKQKADDKFDNDRDVNSKILRALYNNALEFCKVDARNICSHQVPISIRMECRKLSD